MKQNDPEQIKALARSVLETEADAVRQLAERIGDEFVAACRLMLACTGRVVVVGMGKSGRVGGKIAATLASTGTPAFFVHPAEASHGDMGMITAQDVVIALSYSGETAEVTSILPLIKRLGSPLIALTGKPESSLAQAATVHLNVAVEKEACPLGLAPTASTTASLAMGDALAIALLESRGFTADDFALSHPGGSLGKRLLLRVDEIMHTGDDIPRNDSQDRLDMALWEMTRKGLGLTVVVDEHDHMKGVFTDGDLRRVLDRGVNVHAVSLAEVMVKPGKHILQGVLAAEALHVMQEHKINAIPVVNPDGVVVGVVSMHDLLRHGVI